MRYATAALVCLCVLGGTTLLAQPYRCDWGVIGTGGGEMAGASYRCGATAGQTASGTISGSTYSALIGFWLTELQVGVREAALLPRPAALRTELHAPAPNPARGAAAISYSLAAPAHVSVSIHDLAGRSVRVLVNSEQAPGRYSVRWNGADGLGRMLPNGVYLCRFSAGETRQTEKVLLAR